MDEKERCGHQFANWITSLTINSGIKNDKFFSNNGLYRIVDAKVHATKIGRTLFAAQPTAGMRISYGVPNQTQFEESIIFQTLGEFSE